MNSLRIIIASLFVAAIVHAGDAPPLVEGVEAQPLVAQVRRIVEALEFLGSPLPEATKTAIEKAAQGLFGWKKIERL